MTTSVGARSAAGRASRATACSAIAAMSGAIVVERRPGEGALLGAVEADDGEVVRALSMLGGGAQRPDGEQVVEAERRVRQLGRASRLRIASAPSQRWYAATVATSPSETGSPAMVSAARSPPAAGRRCRGGVRPDRGDPAAPQLDRCSTAVGRPPRFSITTRSNGTSTACSPSSASGRPGGEGQQSPRPPGPPADDRPVDQVRPAWPGSAAHLPGSLGLLVGTFRSCRRAAVMVSAASRRSRDAEGRQDHGDGPGAAAARFRAPMFGRRRWRERLLDPAAVLPCRRTHRLDHVGHRLHRTPPARRRP